MKRVLSWIGLIAAVLILSIALFVTGKQHKVFLLNGKKGETVPKVVGYSVDNNEKFKNIRANKKGAVYIKGVNHKLVIRFEDSEGMEQEIQRKFKAKISSDVEINFYDIINDNEEWIKYKKN